MKLMNLARRGTWARAPGLMKLINNWIYTPGRRVKISSRQTNDEICAVDVNKRPFSSLRSS